MKRAAPRPQTLKHLPFFEVLAVAPDGSPEARLATAGLLTLRMIDHWVLAGPAIVEPESVSVRSVRKAIMDLPPREPVREALLTVVNTMQMVRHVDLIPVLPRVFAYGQLLERHHGSLNLAADSYASVIRLADAEFDIDLVMDAYYRLSSCQRRTGALDSAVESATALARIATRRKDRARVLRAKIVIGQVAMMRGQLAAADEQFLLVCDEAARHEFTRELAMATHNRAVVASRSGNATRASLLAHEALKVTFDPIDRDRVLGDLGAFLIQARHYDAARDALRVLEVTASSDEPRVSALVNLVAIAARTGDRRLFDSARADLNGAAMPVEARVNLMIESAQGLCRFGQIEEADSVLREAEVEAGTHGLERSLAEISRVRTHGYPVPAEPAAPEDEGSLEVVAADLRSMAVKSYSGARVS